MGIENHVYLINHMTATGFFEPAPPEKTNGNLCALIFVRFSAIFVGPVQEKSLALFSRRALSAFSPSFS